MVSCHQPRPITHVDGKAIIVNLKPPNRAEIEMVAKRGMEIGMELKIVMEGERLHMTS